MKDRVFYITAAVICVAVVVGLVYGPRWWAVHQAKGEISSQLLDPESARFRNLRYHPGGLGVVCGEVAGKNAYGGYADYKRFFVHGPMSMIDPGPNPRWDQEIVWPDYFRHCVAQD